MPKFVTYITLQDYLATIDSGQLNNQILDAMQAGTNERTFAESWAINKIYEYLENKYDLEFVITPTTVYSYTETYYGGSRIILDFPLWIPKDYAFGDCTINNEIAYICTLQNNDAIFDINKWLALGNQYDLRYIEYPAPIFSLEIEKQKGAFVKGYYQINDIVFWENHTWKCISPTRTTTHDMVIQYVNVDDVPPPNQFPNAHNQQQWLDLGEYSVINEYPFETDGIWTAGDNRNPILVQAVIDLAIWMLHKRIVPNNIPKLREESKNLTFEWLRMCKKGELNLDCPIWQPNNEMSIRWGSSPKVINSYTPISEKY